MGRFFAGAMLIALQWALVPAALYVCAAGGIAHAAEEARMRDHLTPELEAQAQARDEAFFTADYAASIKASRAGLARAEALGRVVDQQFFLRNLAYDHWLMGNLEAAIDYAQRLKLLAEQSDSPLVLSRAHRLLSEINDTLRDFPRAREHAERAVALAQGASARGVRMFGLACLGRCAMHAGDFRTARRHFTMVLQHWEKSSPWNAANARRNLAELAEAGGDLRGALALYDQTSAELSAVGDRRGLARTYYMAASLLRRMGRVADSLARLDLARPLAESIGGHQVLAEFNEELSLGLEAKGDFSGALVAQRQAQRARDALRVAQATVRASDFDARQAIAAKQHAIETLNRQKTEQAEALRVQQAELRARAAELERARVVRWSLAGGLSVGALALGVVIVAQRSRLRAERRSREQTHRALALAERADALKSRLLGVASHDLKAPLRAMLLRADQLRPEVAAAGVDALAGLRADGERMLALVHDLLDMSALESGELKLRLAPCDLNDLTAEIVTSQRPHAEAKQIALQFVPAATAVVVSADRSRLAQAVANLVDNAVKFSPPGASVHVTLVPGVGQVRLEVRDQGPGLSAEDFAQMFQPFQTLSAVPTGGEPSSGLGLHLTRELVARHGGRIDVDSAPGAGATFAIVLPVGASGTEVTLNA